MPTSTDISANWTPHEVALTGSMGGSTTTTTSQLLWYEWTNQAQQTIMG
jgi:hypothetical protein